MPSSTIVLHRRLYTTLNWDSALGVVDRLVLAVSNVYKFNESPESESVDCTAEERAEGWERVGGFGRGKADDSE